MKIAVFCSGGDAPGMNACLRAVTRTAVSLGHEVLGVMRGYQGIIDETFFTSRSGIAQLLMRSVSGISMLGGTILHSSRSKEFMTEAGMIRAADILRSYDVDAIIPIGGNGTFRGAEDFAKYWDGQIIGCPGTIDNDLNGTDYTIGFKTAVQTAVEAVDKLRDTAHSHERMFIVELMGRDSGYITLYTAIAAGCEIACIPERKMEISEIVEKISIMKQRGKESIIMVVAEGYHDGAFALNKKIQDAGCPFPSRVVVLGHLLRGGIPAPDDRILGTKLGNAAVNAVLAGNTGKMVGVDDDHVVLVPFSDAVNGHRSVPDDMVELLECVSQ